MPTTIQFYFVNAYHTKPFTGNRAAVVILDQECIEVKRHYQAIAAEINAPATAFVIRQSDSKYNICWFDPQNELNLCGHATLGASKILFDKLNSSGKYDQQIQIINFDSKFGDLPVKCLDDGRIELKFGAAQLSPLSATFNENKIKMIRETLQKSFRDKSVEIKDLRRGTGDFKEWLLVEFDLSKSPHHSVKALDIDHELIVSASYFHMPTHHLFTLYI
jgi:PhzF family phenazine biosynthesis protein